MLDFPDSPAPGDEFSAGDKTYKFSGDAWMLGATATAPTYVKLSGDTMTGPLVLPGAPVAPQEATHKTYVDESIAAQALYQGVWGVAINTPDLDPAVMVPLHSYSWIAVTADPAVPEVAPAALPGIGGATIGEGDTVIWNGNTSIYEHVRAPTSTAGYLPLAGGTLTGTLVAPEVDIKAGAQAAAGLRLFPSASPNGARIDFQTADGATRKGYVGYGGDTVLMLHAETGCQWQVRGTLGLNVANGPIAVSGAATIGGNATITGNCYVSTGIAVTGGSTLTDDVTMGGDASVAGEITVGGMSHLAHVQSSSHIEAVQNVYANSFVVNAARYGEEMDIPETLRAALADIKALRAEVAALKAGPKAPPPPPSRAPPAPRRRV